MRKLLKPLFIPPFGFYFWRVLITAMFLLPHFNNECVVVKKIINKKNTACDATETTGYRVWHTASLGKTPAYQLTGDGH